MSRIWKVGDNISTDEIIPGRYNVTTDREQLAQAAFIEYRPDYAPNVQQGDVVVAGRNFGMGSSREHAPIALQASGIQAVVARSFARIFYRNAINIGLPILVCDELHEAVEDGDQLALDLATGRIELPDGRTFQVEPLPEFVLRIVQAGGIIPFVQSGQFGQL
ncbi:MAG: 3-isopropylmalate dehydratase small subunit [Chloroflexota bacterium]|nr:3-isopropylmalate dehydratase small subunit [Chloroflexota bacterium]